MKTPKAQSALTAQVLILVSTGFLVACASSRVGDFRIGNTPAAQIAKNPALPGKYETGQCLPYALALNKSFRAAGIPSKVIGFKYENVTNGERLGGAGAHAVVVYNDKGRIYVMDNQSTSPTWVAQGSSAAMMEQFGGMDLSIRKAWTVGNFGFAKSARQDGLMPN